MIRDYSDHAANERTFLAWVRTGVAIAALGFVIEKFNLFLFAMTSTQMMDTRHPPAIEKLSGPFGRYDGFVVTLFGVALIVAAAMRFIRVRRLIQDQDTHNPGGYRAELVLSTALALVLATSSMFLLFGR